MINQTISLHKSLDDQAAADRILSTVLSPAINRPVDELRERLPIGHPEICAERLAAYAKAGVQSIFVWPLEDELEQLQLFAERVMPLIPNFGSRVGDQRPDFAASLVKEMDGLRPGTTLRPKDLQTASATFQNN